MSRWNYLIEYEDDQEDLDIEADSLDHAAQLIYEKWSPTAWQLASLEGLVIDLDAPTFAEALSRRAGDQK